MGEFSLNGVHFSDKKSVRMCACVHVCERERDLRSTTSFETFYSIPSTEEKALSDSYAAYLWCDMLCSNRFVSGTNEYHDQGM